MEGMMKKLWEWWKKDTIIIVIVITALAVVLYSYTAAEDYKNQCNNYWTAELEYKFIDCTCRNGQPVVPIFNNSFEYNKLIVGDKQ